MSDFFTLIAPFFSTPKNYAQMLKKLAGFVFYETYAITIFLRDIPAIATAFHSIETYGTLGSVISAIPNAQAINITGIGIAILFALVSHVIQLHDRISDLLGIRKRFDQKKILLPLSGLVHVRLTPMQQQVLVNNRDRLMRDVFYRYASSRAENPLVDKHDIEHALAAWSWFWVLLEAVVLLGAGACVAIVFGGAALSGWFLIVAAACFILAIGQYLRLGRYARAQIETIASDRDASNEVRDKFNAL